MNRINPGMSKPRLRVDLTASHHNEKRSMGDSPGDVREEPVT